MNTIRHLLEIAAPPEAVFGAVTTADGLARWWTTGVSAGAPEVGARIHVTFRGSFNPEMEITSLEAPEHVEWRGVGGHAAWGAVTTIRFDLSPAGDGTRVVFTHRKGDEVGADGVARANFTWGYYLDSLRRLCETGTGKPFRPGAEGTRVGADSLG